MNIQPRRTTEKILKESYPKEFELFGRRLSYLSANYGHHPRLPKREHGMAGKKPREQVVLLDDFCTYVMAEVNAGADGWTDVEPLFAGLQYPPIGQAVANGASEAAISGDSSKPQPHQALTAIARDRSTPANTVALAPTVEAIPGDGGSTAPRADALAPTLQVVPDDMAQAASGSDSSLTRSENQMAITLGAFAIFFERYLLAGEQVTRGKYLDGNSLNCSGVAKKLEALFKNPALGVVKDSKGFSHEAIRKNLAAAMVKFRAR